MRKMCYLFRLDWTLNFKNKKLFQQKQALYNWKVFSMNELLEKLENNSFIDKVRMDLEFEDRKSVV